jgi:DeoR family transcriptional regulator, fructose operon transcriptional repressor
MKLTKEQRRSQIEQIVVEKQRVTVNELSAIFDATRETIRNDLRMLSEQNRVTRYHGGATIAKSQEKEAAFSLKVNLNEFAKRAIAYEAASFIHDGDTIYVDVGSTTVHLADAVNAQNIKIITNSLAAAHSFSRALERKQFSGEIICVGGIVNSAQQSLYGALTMQILQQFHIHKAFISCGGMTKQYVYDFDIEEAVLSQKMVEISDASYLLIDQSKINKQAFAKISRVSHFHKIISDGYCPWDEWQTIWHKVVY